MIEEALIFDALFLWWSSRSPTVIQRARDDEDTLFESEILFLKVRLRWIFLPVA